MPRTWIPSASCMTEGSSWERETDPDGPENTRFRSRHALSGSGEKAEQMSLDFWASVFFTCSLCLGEQRVRDGCGDVLGCA